MALRGLRGATTVETNTPDAIRDATRELLTEMIEANDIQREDIASAWFTTTTDLNAEFPAVVARNDFGWTNVALMCAHELDVPGSLQMCLRILMHVNTESSAADIKHVYLHGARILRRDLVEEPSTEVGR
jgi:chorismate mutase